MVLGSTNKAHESLIDKAMPLYNKQPFISLLWLAVRPMLSHNRMQGSAREEEQPGARSGHQRWAKKIA